MKPIRNLLLSVGITIATGAGAQSNLPVRVDGSGYLRFIQNGKMVYAKSAELTIVQGRLGIASGAKLVPAIEAATIQEISIDLNGQVKCTSGVIGSIVLAIFDAELPNPGDAKLIETASRPILAEPGDGETGVIRTTSSKSFVPPKRVVANKGSLAVDIKRPEKSEGLVINIPESAEVDLDTFRLGDIAQITGKSEDVQKASQLDLGTTPPINIPRVIEQSKILYRLKSAGIDVSTVRIDGAAKTRVMRKGQTITHEQFVEAATRGAQMKGYSNLSSDAPGVNFVVLAGELQLVCESVTSTENGINVTVGAYVDGKRFNSRTVKLRSTNISLRPGTVISVRVKSNAVMVELKAKVIKSDTTTGQVTVQTLDTGAQLIGVVKSDGTVEVKA